MTGAPGPRARELAVAALVAAAAFVVAAWPWVRLAGVAIPDPALAGNPAWGADARLIVWILAWDVHALLEPHVRLFDAPIFHPAPDMLAGSEHLLGALPIAGPVAVLSGSPVLAANVAAMASYVGGAVAGWACLRALGVPRAPSAMGAAALALGPLRLPADLHVLQYPAWALPLVVAVAGRARPPVVAAAVALAIFASYYAAAMVAVALAVEVALVALAGGRRPAVRLAAAAAVAFAALAAVSGPYLRPAGQEGPEAAAAVQQLAGAYVTARFFEPANPGFGLGVVVACLAPLGLLAPAFRRRAPGLAWWRWVAFVLLGVAIARGTFAGTPLGALRAASRFIVLAHLGLVGLAADGAALALGVVPARLRAAAGLVLVAVTAVPLAARITDVPYARLLTPDTVRPADRVLAAAPRGPLLELPPGGEAPLAMLRQSEAMVHQLVHRQPLVDGHTGYPPWWAPAIREEERRLPDPRAVQALVDLTGLAWILVPRAHHADAEPAAWERAGAALEPVPGAAPDLLFRTRLAPRRPWAAAIARGAPAPGRTILGTPIAPLEPTAARGWVAVPRPPRRAAASAVLPVPVVVHHEGTSDWPALAPPHAPDRLLVVLRARWRALGAEPPVPDERVRLPRDVVAGEDLAATAGVRTPAAPGRYELSLELVQVDGTPFPPGGDARLPIEVRRPGPPPG